MTLDQWNEEAKTDIRFLPKYGYAEKSPEQLEADAKFLRVTLPQFASERLASEHYIEVGFSYLYHDIKKAMYRFNQAYLLDSTNSDIYWGYGGVYMILEDYHRAREQYEEGLLHDPVNTRIMTDYGTYFVILGMPDSAIQYLSRSYMLDNTNQNTSFKLAAFYYFKDDCKNAMYYYERCKSLGGQPLRQEFVDSLQMKCSVFKNYEEVYLPDYYKEVGVIFNKYYTVGIKMSNFQSRYTPTIDDVKKMEEIFYKNYNDVQKENVDTKVFFRHWIRQYFGLIDISGDKNIIVQLIDNTTPRKLNHKLGKHWETDFLIYFSDPNPGRGILFKININTGEMTKEL